MGTFNNHIGVLDQDQFPTSGLTAYWRMEEFGTVANDVLGAINLNMVNINTTTGKNHYGFALTGNTQTLSGQTNTQFDFEYTDSWSISMWVKRTATGVISGLFSKELSVAPYTGYFFGWYAANKFEIIFVAQSAVKIECISVNTFTDTTNFYHVVWTYNGGGTASGNKLYVNGALQSVTTPYLSISTTLKNTAFWGTRYNNDSQYTVHGIIDEMAYWNRVLGQEEITRIYNLGTGIYY